MDSQKCQQGAAGSDLARTGSERAGYPSPSLSLGHSGPGTPVPLTTGAQIQEEYHSWGVLKGALSQLLWSSAKVHGMPRVSDYCPLMVT